MQASSAYLSIKRPADRTGPAGYKPPGRVSSSTWAARSVYLPACSHGRPAIDHDVRSGLHHFQLIGRELATLPAGGPFSSLLFLRRGRRFGRLTAGGSGPFKAFLTFAIPRPSQAQMALFARLFCLVPFGPQLHGPIPIHGLKYPRNINTVFYMGDYHG